jgi:uncharacterized membrane protein YczE
MGRDLVSLLLPIPQDNRARRFAQLYSGLLTYGFSTALMVRADLGLNPWDVFHQGAAAASGLTIGAATIGTAVIVLTFWIPIRQRPGLGTISNVVVIGMAVDVSLALLPTPGLLLERSVYLTAGIALNAVATGMYIGAGMGPGPRDGLMTGLAARGFSVRAVRTSIELSVLLVGWSLGGQWGSDRRPTR